MTYQELTEAMRFGTTQNIGRYRGKIMAIELEDGSGNCFNVTLLTDSGVKKEFIRVADTIKRGKI